MIRKPMTQLKTEQKTSKQILHQRRYRDGIETIEKMLNIICH